MVECLDVRWREQTGMMTCLPTIVTKGLGSSVRRESYLYDSHQWWVGFDEAVG